MVVVLVWVALWGAVAIPYWFVALPQPGEIGPKFKYVGKYVSYCVLVCDQQTWQEYYYVTDMTEGELIALAKNATYHPATDSSSDVGYASDYQYRDMSFSVDKLFFSLKYFDKKNSPIVAKDFSLNERYVNGHFLVGVRDTDFQAFKDAIK